MKKCIIVWGEQPVSNDGARAFVPVKEYPLGNGDSADKAMWEKAKKEIGQKPVMKPKSNSYFWEAGQVDYLTSTTLKLTEGYTN